MQITAQHRQGFTLIELLVVVSIIALLISILLPTLSSARRAAHMSQSLSNLRQINIAANTYRADHENHLPNQMVYQGNRNMPCSWGFGGAFASDHWAGENSGLRDVAPSGRPLNDYLYPGKLHAPVTGTSGQDDKPIRPANNSERADLDLPVFRDPRDGDTLQRTPFGEPTPGISSYQDVGTSYHSNFKWIFQLKAEVKAANPSTIVFDRLMHDMGSQRLRNQSHLDTSRFVLYTDRVGDAIRETYRSVGLDRIEGQYGKPNHAGMAFLDGHAAFEDVQPGVHDPENYTFYFKR